MHGEIDAAGGEGFFDFFGENSFAESPFRADHGERDVGDFVAGGVDDFDFYFVAAGAEKGGDVVGLPKGELGTAGADAEVRHGRRPVAGYRRKAKGGWLGRLEN
jgi:hypothetical protein